MVSARASLLLPAVPPAPGLPPAPVHPATPASLLLRPASASASASAPGRAQPPPGRAAPPHPERSPRSKRESVAGAVRRTEVPRMILVPQNPVVVLPARVTPARWVLSVLPNPPVAHLHMPALLPALVLGGRLRTQTRTGQSLGRGVVGAERGRCGPMRLAGSAWRPTPSPRPFGAAPLPAQAPPSAADGSAVCWRRVVWRPGFAPPREPARPPSWPRKRVRGWAAASVVYAPSWRRLRDSAGARSTRRGSDR